MYLSYAFKIDSFCTCTRYNNYFNDLSKDQKKQIKEIFIPGFELEVAVQEVDVELKKIIFIVDFNEFLDDSSDDTEKVDE